VLDAEGHRFWSLRELTSAVTHFPSHPEIAAFPDASSYFVFADWAIECWQFAVCLPGSQTTVLILPDFGFHSVSDSFEEFLALYEAGDSRIHHPEKRP